MKLSEISKAINAYLNLYTDKEVTNISIQDETSDVMYEIQLHDDCIWPFGKDPFPRDESIRIMKDGSFNVSGRSIPTAKPETMSDSDVLQSILLRKDDLLKMEDVPETMKLSLFWEHLTFLRDTSGNISDVQIKAFWADFAMELMECD